MSDIDKKFHHLTLKTGPSLFGATVLLDGEPMKGVRSININSGIDRRTSVTIEMIASVEADITGDLCDAPQKPDVPENITV